MSTQVSLPKLALGITVESLEKGVILDKESRRKWK